jgi:hypothetical protein
MTTHHFYYQIVKTNGMIMNCQISKNKHLRQELYGIFLSVIHVIVTLVVVGKDALLLVAVLVILTTRTAQLEDTTPTDI